VKTKDQQIMIIILFMWIATSCVGGLIAGMALAPHLMQPKNIIITEVVVYELAITQVQNEATYTPYPTYTPVPPSSTSFPTLTPISPKTHTPAPLPSYTPTKTPQSFYLNSFSWSVYPGEMAHIQVITQPGVKCSITYHAPDEQKVDLPELASLLANEKGECTWRWPIPERSPIGTATLIVTALGESQTYYLQILQSTDTP
jgi:hypothetical protein